MSEGKEAEQLHIGQKLKDARVAKGMTLDDLQQATKIQKRYLIAIEDEKFDELPGDFYVRAFVKQYANTVGLDGNDLLKQYDDYLPKTKTETYTEHLDEAVETRTGQHHHNTIDRVDQLRKHLPTIIVVLIVVVVLAAIWVTAIVRNHNNSSTKIDSSSVKVSGESSHKRAKKTTKKADKIKLNQTQRTNSAVTFKSDKALKKSTKLQVSTIGGNSYNVVRVDDRQRLAKNMADGDKANITIAKNVHSITIRISNASHTKIKIGNQTLDITDHNRYPQTRTVTIQFGDSNSSSSSSTTNSNNTSRTTTTPSNSNNGGGNSNTTSNNSDNGGSRATTTQQPARQTTTTTPNTNTQTTTPSNGGGNANTHN